MEFVRYAAFLPEEYRGALEPERSWWEWRGMRVHIARAARPEAGVRVLALHGAGGHAGLMWPFAAMAVREGAEVIVPDLPLYGDTMVPDRRGIRYSAWVDLVCELVERETAADSRPLILFGASIGGMLAYEAAARTGRAAHVVATCLLDPGDPRSLTVAARFPVPGRVGSAVLRGAASVAGRVLVPVRWCADLGKMSRDPALSRLCASDPRGGGSALPIGFLADFFAFRHTAPEAFDAAPVTLVQPAADTWTPPESSIRFLDRIAAPTELVMLDNCGHFPIEEPGIGTLADTLRAVRDGPAASAAD
ncbi:alpha/beta hydrolase [Nocardia bovistercoris]|uniref:Alpha/beta hydrolase n=1 Tax=Nocardia bovistercoris TaxID=2785916 RepID=A0A931N1U5_9NOCA|nr:alpha/beta hydrolase [Nocardia bovistercoris]MBH0776284.1 alpha/beta hydrolase [Nocardia bovistercoris]